MALPVIAKVPILPELNMYSLLYFRKKRNTHLWRTKQDWWRDGMSERSYFDHARRALSWEKCPCIRIVALGLFYYFSASALSLVNAFAFATGNPEMTPHQCICL